jgi:hypothetical protein
MHHEMYLDSRGTLARPRTYGIRRRDVRYVCSIPFTLERFLRFGPVATRAMMLDVSMRGMSALVCGAPRVGETVVIELRLRGEPVEMLATVHYSSDVKSGFEFFPLSPTAEQGIQEWIEELRKNEETRLSRMFAVGTKFGSD